MNTATPNDLLLRFLHATPAQQAAIECVLSGQAALNLREPTGPLLLGMSAAAKRLGVSRATLWRMVRSGRLRKIEILPGSFRLRVRDLETIGE